MRATWKKKKKRGLVSYLMKFSTASSVSWKPDKQCKPPFFPRDGEIYGPLFLYFASCKLPLPVHELLKRNSCIMSCANATGQTLMTDVEYLTFDHANYDEKLLEAVVYHAASHGVNHLDIPSFYVRYRVFRHKIFTQCKALKLQLENFEFEGSFSLTTLTSLRLAFCGSFCYGLPGCFDFISYFPNLKNLELKDCEFRNLVVKISSPKLLHLTILLREGGLEIDAPNLTYLKYKFWGILPVSLTNLTSLQLVAIDLMTHFHTVLSHDSAVKFSLSLHNVQPLYISDRAVKVLGGVPGLDGEPTPFTRLKNWCSNCRFDEIPAKVSTYLRCNKFEFMSYDLMFSDQFQVMARIIETPQSYEPEV